MAQESIQLQVDPGFFQSLEQAYLRGSVTAIRKGVASNAIAINEPGSVDPEVV